MTGTKPSAPAVRCVLYTGLAALLVLGAGCAGKKKTALASPPAPESIKAASPASSGTVKEEKPGFFSRLNPFRKKETPPAEQASAPTAEEKPKEVASTSEEPEKRGYFSRWFGRSKTLPYATQEEVNERKVVTAKGEVSPPLFEHNGLKLTIGGTSKARIIATYGEPENTFFSDGAEEILIYRRIHKVDSLYIFLDSQGVVKDYIITKRP